MLRKFVPNSLQSRLIAVLILVVCPIMLTAVLWIGSRFAAYTQISAQQQLTAQATSVANNVERWDHYLVMALETLRGQRDIKSMNPALQLPALEQMQKTYERLQIVRVTRPDGISVVRTDGTTPVNYGDRDWFKACMAGQNVARQALITKTSNVAALNISIPILDDSGKVVGVLSADTNLASISDAAGISTNRDDEKIFVVDERGRVLAAPGMQKSSSLKDISASAPVVRLMEGWVGMFEFSDASGEEWITQTVKLPNGWSVIYQIPKIGVIDRSTQVMDTAYMVGAISILFMIGFAIVVARRVAKPIREMTLAADALAAGDWSRRVDCKRDNELGRLATSFNQMAGQLEAAYRQVEARSSQLQKINSEIYASEERYALAIRGANDGLWDWDVKAGCVHYSERWKEMLGCADQQIGDSLQEWFSRVHPDDLESFQSAIASHCDGVTPLFQVEHRMLHSDGRYRWMLSRGIAVRDAAGKATRMAGSQTDVTARREAEDQLLRDALHDGLTGLPNRVLFCDRLERSLTRMLRDSKHNFAVLFLDIDRFKGINDSLGHGLGDQLLVAFARRIGGLLRPSDTFARLGGDEFTILLEDPHEPDDATTVAGRLIDALKEPFDIESHEIYITTSIGIACGDSRYTRPQEILRDADTAMYRAKAKGKSRFEVFDIDMHTRAVKLLQLENDLRRAIDHQEFEVFYQPIIRMSNGRVRAFEALIRWRHPEQGLIAPGDFIPIAEETGLIVPIGWWVLEQACRQTVQWHALTPERAVDINVNLSGKQFSQPDLVDRVLGMLRDTGLDPKHLILEMTESVVMENPEATAKVLQRLKDLGVQLNIDDFGTGYSSLANLQKFPVDTMKIDRSFVAGMIDSPENAEIIRTIVHLAHSLKMNVTAEGIENPEQLAQLEMLQCESAQGFLFSRPLDSKAATALLCHWTPQNAARHGPGNLRPTG
jgi:diguanylate cyclase (GGDEF)-like protein/PAS domain S-box-containing protein